eukprot:4179465-Pyramimonas_sp.AAC.1
MCAGTAAFVCWDVCKAVCCLCVLGYVLGFVCWDTCQGVVWVRAAPVCSVCPPSPLRHVAP